VTAAVGAAPGGAIKPVFPESSAAAAEMVPDTLAGRGHRGGGHRQEKPARAAAGPRLGREGTVNPFGD
jgi:hypothetical protein